MKAIIEHLESELAAAKARRDDFGDGVEHVNRKGMEKIGRLWNALIDANTWCGVFAESGAVGDAGSELGVDIERFEKLIQWCKTNTAPPPAECEVSIDLIDRLEVLADASAAKEDDQLIREAISAIGPIVVYAREGTPPPADGGKKVGRKPPPELMLKICDIIEADQAELIKTLTDRVKELEGERDKFSGLLDVANSNCDTFERKIADLRKQVENAERRKRLGCGVADKLGESLRTADNERDEQDIRITTLTDHVKELEWDKVRLGQRITHLEKATIADLRKEGGDLEVACANSLTALQAAERERDEVKKRLKAMTYDRDTYRRKLTGTERERVEWKRESDRWEDKLTTANSERDAAILIGTNLRVRVNDDEHRWSVDESLRNAALNKLLTATQADVARLVDEINNHIEIWNRDHDFTEGEIITLQAAAAAMETDAKTATVHPDTARLGFQKLQNEVTKWAFENFGGCCSYQPLLCALEELGELAHAHLKQEQGIRTNEDHAANKVDAVADVVIALAHYCGLNEIDFQEAIEKTWAQVSKRDWKNDPENADHSPNAGEKVEEAISTSYRPRDLTVDEWIESIGQSLYYDPERGYKFYSEGGKSVWHPTVLDALQFAKPTQAKKAGGEG